MLKAWSILVHWTSFEWLLDDRPNGGDIILLRAVCIAALVHLASIGIKQGLDPGRTLVFSMNELLRALSTTLPWFGAIFAAVYAALYARFSSQWMYLANIYNEIKQTEARTARDDHPGSKAALADWKAGLMEDAEELHLATKGIFASVIKIWAENDDVKQAFIQNTPGGQKRFNDLMRKVSSTYQRQEQRFANH